MLPAEIPPTIFMLKNRVHVCIDGVSTMALVDTGATVYVMSLLFKSLLGRKLMFC